MYCKSEVSVLTIVLSLNKYRSSNRVYHLSLWLLCCELYLIYIQEYLVTFN